ncbi:hypothetical protein V6N12_066181 [Hibiscus sabdariffa]|uniref:Uncharacterized protein n=1 Tax=Hibiscus sabdariffa TaxID=183260 RepID=A0ABR2BAU3_9ROSI
MVGINVLLVLKARADAEAEARAETLAATYVGAPNRQTFASADIESGRHCKSPGTSCSQLSERGSSELSPVIRCSMDGGALWKTESYGRCKVSRRDMASVALLHDRGIQMKSEHQAWLRKDDT